MGSISQSVLWAILSAVHAPLGKLRLAEPITGPPAKVSGVVPTDGSVNIQLDQVVTWDRPAMAKWYDVYLDTVNPPVEKVSDNQTARAYVPTLALDTTYYLRINAANALGETAGDVVSFSTWNSADIVLDEPGGNPVTDSNGEYIETTSARAMQSADGGQLVDALGNRLVFA